MYYRYIASQKCEKKRYTYINLPSSYFLKIENSTWGMETKFWGLRKVCIRPSNIVVPGVWRGNTDGFRIKPHGVTLCVKVDVLTSVPILLFLNLWFNLDFV